MRTKADHGFRLLQGALTLPLPQGWRVLAAGPAWAEIDTGERSATITLRVDRYEDPQAIRSQDLSAYITPGEDNPYSGLRWDPSQGYAFLARPDHRDQGPHFVLVDAVPFGPWIYRIEYALPLRRMPEGANAAGALLDVQPIPRLMSTVLPGLLFDPPSAEAPPEPLSDDDSWLKAGCFEFRLPQHWIAETEALEDGELHYVIEDSRDRDCGTLWIDAAFLAGAPPAQSGDLEAIALALAEEANKAISGMPDDAVAVKRPRGAPTVCDWRKDEALLKARSCYLDESSTAGRIDDEYGLRFRSTSAGYQMVHYHLCFPQERRFDAAFQATANRLWLNFLDGRFLEPS